MPPHIHFVSKCPFPATAGTTSYTLFLPYREVITPDDKIYIVRGNDHILIILKDPWEKKKKKEYTAALAVVRPHLSVTAPTLLEQTAAKVGNTISQNEVIFLKEDTEELTHSAF